MQRVRAQLSGIRIVNKQHGEIVIDELVKAFRNGLQQPGQIEIRDDRVIDLKQQPGTFVQEFRNFLVRLDVPYSTPLFFA
jgi:hypothetical protein